MPNPVTSALRHDIPSLPADQKEVRDFAALLDRSINPQGSDVIEVCRTVRTGFAISRILLSVEANGEGCYFRVAISEGHSYYEGSTLADEAEVTPEGSSQQVMEDENSEADDTYCLEEEDDDEDEDEDEDEELLLATEHGFVFYLPKKGEPSLVDKSVSMIEFDGQYNSFEVDKIDLSPDLDTIINGTVPAAGKTEANNTLDAHQIGSLAEHEKDMGLLTEYDLEFIKSALEAAGIIAKREPFIESAVKWAPRITKRILTFIVERLPE